MQRLSRPIALKIAAVLSIIVALYAIPAYDIPGLMAGPGGSQAPYWLIVGSFISDILALVAAYGAWRGRRWGSVLLVGVMVYWTLQAILGLLFAETSFDTAFSSGMLVHHLVVFALCFWPARPAPQAA
jgi:hypothetical protein